MIGNYILSWKFPSVKKRFNLETRVQLGNGVSDSVRQNLPFLMKKGFNHW